MKRQRLPELKLFIRFDSVKSTQTMHISYSCSVLSQNASFQRYFPILRKKINRKIAFRVLHQNPSKHTNFIELSIIRVHCSWIHFHFSCVDTTTFLRHQTQKNSFDLLSFRNRLVSALVFFTCFGLQSIYLSKSLHFTNYRSNVDSRSIVCRPWKKSSP